MLVDSPSFSVILLVVRLEGRIRQMSLLREIQNEVSSGQSRLSDILRKCKILAARLDSSEFDEWIELELNGYPKESILPNYRVYDKVRSVGVFVGAMGIQFENQVPNSSIPEAIRPDYEVNYFRDGISIYEDMLANSTKGEFCGPWPPELVNSIDPIYRGYNLFRAEIRIPRSAFVKVADSVRTSILGFALDIEKQNPDAGEANSKELPIPKEVTQQVFNNHFHGSVGTMNMTGDQAQITTTTCLQIIEGD
jgi:AbiTii